jgi:hypothetical protein
MKSQSTIATTRVLLSGLMPARHLAQLNGCGGGVGYTRLGSGIADSSIVIHVGGWIFQCGPSWATAA